MEDVDNTYYKLYVSLLNEDENEVKRIWMKNSSEKFFRRYSSLAMLNQASVYVLLIQSIFKRIKSRV